MCISLTVDGCDSLTCALDEFLSSQKFTEHVYCKSCDMRVAVSKTLRIHETSPVFVVHLKRFSDSAKLSKHISFDDTVSVKIFTREHHYSLFAVLEHVGSECASGHFVAYVCVGLNRCWIQVDNVTCKRVSFAVVQAAQAYLLYFCPRV